MSLIQSVNFYYILRILLATFCGACIGFERERRFKTAGIRTHIIVALSACLMMIVSKYGFWDVVGMKGITLDVSRIAAGVVTAIGFLGAGVIFVKKESITGVTTAAGLWATVGVGIAIGAGMYTIGLATTIIMVVLQVLLHKRSRLFNLQNYGKIILTLDPHQFTEELLQTVTKDKKIIIRSMEMISEGNKVIVKLAVVFPPNFTSQDVIEELHQHNFITSIEYYPSY